MYCNKCGNKLADNSISCDSCGYVFVYNAVGNPVINKTVDNINIDSSKGNKKLVIGFLLGAGITAALMIAIPKLTGGKSSGGGSTTEIVATADSKEEGTTLDAATDDDAGSADDTQAVDNTEITSIEDGMDSVDEATDEEPVTSEAYNPTQADTSFIDSMKQYVGDSLAANLWYLLITPVGYEQSEVEFVAAHPEARRYTISLDGVEFEVQITDNIDKIYNDDYVIYEDGKLLLEKSDIVY